MDYRARAAPRLCNSVTWSQASPQAAWCVTMACLILWKVVRAWGDQQALVCWVGASAQAAGAANLWMPLPRRSSAGRVGRKGVRRARVLRGLAARSSGALPAAAGCSSKASDRLELLRQGLPLLGCLLAFHKDPSRDWVKESLSQQRPSRSEQLLLVRVRRPQLKSR